eukprot:SAG31_NODE_24110_length_489_cov_0.658974_1_plen_20_part_01
MTYPVPGNVNLIKLNLVFKI